MKIFATLFLLLLAANLHGQGKRIDQFVLTNTFGGADYFLFEKMNTNAYYSIRGSNLVSSVTSGLSGGSSFPLTNDANFAGFSGTNIGSLQVTGIAKVKHIQIGTVDAFASQDISIFKSTTIPGETDKAWINIAQVNNYLTNYTIATEWWANSGTNDSVMAMSWLTRTNRVTDGTNTWIWEQDGTENTSYWSTGGDPEYFFWSMRYNGRDVLNFSPNKVAEPNYVFDTSIAQVSGPILEVRNNSNTVFAIDFQGNVTADGLLSASNNFVSPTNAPTDAFVLTATGTGGSTKWAVAAAGGGTNGWFEYTLGSTAAIGATSLTLDRTFVPPATIAGHIAIGFGTTNCEIRGVASVSGNTITAFGTARPLTFAHAAGEKVVWFTGDAYCAFWGMKGDYATGNGTDNSWAMIQALFDTSQEGIRLIGNGSFGISMPMVLGVSAAVADIKVSALNIYTANANTNSWFFINQAGTRYTFSVSGATNTIITGVNGDWPADATNMMVVPYGIGGTNLPTGLTNGIPVFVKAWNTNWLRVGLTVDSTNEITLGTGTGFLYSRVGLQSKIYLDQVYLDGGIKAGINGLYACVQQPAQMRYLRLDNFLGTAMKLPPGVQQVDINNLEIINCGIGLETLGASFIYIKALNVELYTNALVGGAHIWGMHIEQCKSTNGVSIDLTREAGSDLMIDGFSATLTSPPHTYFLLSDSDSRAAVDLRRLSVYGEINSGLIAISDPRNGPDIHAWNETNGLSAGKYISQYKHGVIPETSQHRNEFGGFNWPGGDGRLVQFGAEFADFPTMRLRASTNQTGNALELLNSNGTTNFAVGPNGSVFLATNAVAPSPLGTGGWLWNSNQVLYWVTSAQTNLIADGR